MASIRKRKLATGAITWQVQIRRTGEQSITQTFQRKADAVAYISQTEHRLDRGATAKDLNKGRTPVAEVIDWYLGRFNRGKGQIYQLEWWRQHLGRFEIRKITSGVLGDALHQLEKEKRSPATVNRYRAELSLPSDCAAGKFALANACH